MSRFPFPVQMKYHPHKLPAQTVDLSQSLCFVDMGLCIREFFNGHSEADYSPYLAFPIVGTLQGHRFLATIVQSQNFHSKGFLQLGGY